MLWCVPLARMPRSFIKVIFCLTMGVLTIILVLRIHPEVPHDRLHFLHWMRNDTSKSSQFAYHHVIDQLQWVSEFSNNYNDLSFGKVPSIYFDRHLLYHPTTSHGCRYKCHFPKSYANLSKGDGAVFSVPFQPLEAANLRDKGVFIVFESGESPYFMPSLGPSHLNQIDMFISFMSASPVPYVYSVFVRNVNPKDKFSEKEKIQLVARNSTHLLPPFHNNRSKLIAWVVSNSSPSNNRKEFASAISTFTKVDVYGRGFIDLAKGAHSFQWLSKQYKFYLAFENSNCRDYITEKAFVNALRNDMVPIVLGAYKEDYENALPPHSYINVDDFGSIQQLVDYLHYLDRNDTAYASYFAWKEYGKIVVRFTKSYTLETINRPDCRLCGFIYHLNAGKIDLPKLDLSYFVDPTLSCFNRSLLPMQPSNVPP